MSIRLISFLICLQLSLSSCVGLGDDVQEGIYSFTEATCSTDYDGSIEAVTALSSFDLQENTISIIGDRSSLQYWNNVGRQYDTRISVDDGESYFFFNGENVFYDYDNSDAHNKLIADYHLYGNLDENEWFDLTLNSQEFVMASNPSNTTTASEIFSLVIFQVDEDYQPSECEPNYSCTERTQTAYYELVEATITDLGAGQYDMTIEFEISSNSTEHYPSTITLIISATITEIEGYDDHPELSYSCNDTYFLYSGDVTGSCPDDYTEVGVFQLTDGRMDQQCFDCVVTRDGISEEDDEGGYELSQNMTDECIQGISNTFESYGFLEI